MSCLSALVVRGDRSKYSTIVARRQYALTRIPSTVQHSYSGSWPHRKGVTQESLSEYAEIRDIFVNINLQ